MGPTSSKTEGAARECADTGLSRHACLALAHMLCGKQQPRGSHCPTESAVDWQRSGREQSLGLPQYTAGETFGTLAVEVRASLPAHAVPHDHVGVVSIPGARCIQPPYAKKKTLITQRTVPGSA